MHAFLVHELLTLTHSTQQSRKRTDYQAATRPASMSLRHASHPLHNSSVPNISHCALIWLARLVVILQFSACLLANDLSRPFALRPASALACDAASFLLSGPTPSHSSGWGHSAPLLLQCRLRTGHKARDTGYGLDMLAGWVLAASCPEVHVLIIRVQSLMRHAGLPNIFAMCWPQLASV